jgi:hypothetical protein
MDRLIGHVDELCFMRRESNSTSEFLVGKRSFEQKRLLLNHPSQSTIEMGALALCT